MIHINSGQTAVGEFIEELGIHINELKQFFVRCDEKSLKNAEYRKTQNRTISRDTDGDQYYQPGGVE
jgi:hypothetical protein